MFVACHSRNKLLQLKYLDKVIAIAMTLFFLLIFLNPEAASKLTPPCLFKSIFNTDYCWGCGITRAFFALFKGHFSEALQYNKSIVIVAPALTVVYIRFMYKTLKNWKQ